MTYSFDTSALIKAWRDLYPRDIFPTVWELFDKLVKEGRLLAVEEVRRELERQEDELLKWVKARPAIFVPLGEPLQRRTAEIIERFPSLIQTGGLMRGAADPFIIALAAERKLTVVTAEWSKPSKPRIPDVCKALGIRCMTLVELFRQEGWRV